MIERVLCISTVVPFKDVFRLISIGKIYKIIETSVYGYKISNNAEEIFIYPKKCFLKMNDSKLWELLF